MSQRRVMFMVWDLQADRVYYRGKRADKAARASIKLDVRGIPNRTDVIVKAGR